jgi:hypothetical protein
MDPTAFVTNDLDPEAAAFVFGQYLLATSTRCSRTGERCDDCHGAQAFTSMGYLVILTNCHLPRSRT